MHVCVTGVIQDHAALEPGRHIISAAPGLLDVVCHIGADSPQCSRPAVHSHVSSGGQVTSHQPAHLSLRPQIFSFGLFRYKGIQSEKSYIHMSSHQEKQKSEGQKLGRVQTTCMCHIIYHTAAFTWLNLISYGYTQSHSHTQSCTTGVKPMQILELHLNI